MLRKLALILTIFAVLCTLGTAVPGLTGGTAMACDNPGCLSTSEPISFCNDPSCMRTIKTPVFCNDPSCV